MDDVAAFARLIDALRPWLNRLVIIGGWAHRLYRFDERAVSPLHRPLVTKDADVAIADTVSLGGDIGAALEAAHFKEEFSGEHTPPVSLYRLDDERNEFFAEFLAPLHGDGLRQSGRRDATVLAAGITAQKLRHLDLLLHFPWTVRVAPPQLPLSIPTDVPLPNPVSFIAQKLLIRKHRKPYKQAQDVLYIHDTLELFGDELETLRAVWRDQLRPVLARKTAKRLQQLQREQFATLTDVVREAARIPQDRTLSPERVQAACAYGLDEIFRA